MKIGLIIDNPRRDLRGMLLLGKKFLDNNCQVYLIPNYHLYESFLLNLDWVILHNCRVMQKKYISLFMELNIKIAILDTEGAQLGPNNQDLKYFANLVADNLIDIDLYFAWGNLQKKAIQKKLEDKNITNLIKKCKVTGHPRFELYENYYLNFQQPIEKTSKIITFNTNFVWNNPRFSKDAKNELDIGVKQYYGEEKVAKEKFEKELYLKKEFIGTIKKIATYFKNHKIIINPHPFEKINDYKNLSKNYSNIIVIKDTYLPKLFKSSDYLISYNCQTCVDSYLMGYKTLSINFIDHKNQLSDYYRSICENVKSIEHLIEIINDSSYNKTIKENNRKISEIFYSQDSQSDSIVKHILSEKLLDKNYSFSKNINIFFKISLFGKTNFFSYFRLILKFFLILFSSSNTFYNLKSIMMKNYFYKKYNREDVCNFYNLLYKKGTVKTKHIFAKKYAILFKKLSTLEIKL